MKERLLLKAVAPSHHKAPQWLTYTSFYLFLLWQSMTGLLHLGWSPKLSCITNISIGSHSETQALNRCRSLQSPNNSTFKIPWNFIMTSQSHQWSIKMIFNTFELYNVSCYWLPHPFLDNRNEDATQFINYSRSRADATGWYIKRPSTVSGLKGTCLWDMGQVNRTSWKDTLQEPDVYLSAIGDVILVGSTSSVAQG